MLRPRLGNRFSKMGPEVHAFRDVLTTKQRNMRLENVRQDLT